MGNIQVHRYAPGDGGDWAGWIEDEERTWILFVHEDGSVMAFLNRDETGAVV